ncbi:MAG: fructose-bisphosphate aldolase [Chloroflexi bacterium]|nr:fructose-bisphosphate aldolase [Chloroflexota bacterium]
MTPLSLNKERSLIVAMDHGRTHGVIQGLENPRTVLETIVSSGIDGILTTFGVLKHFRSVIPHTLPVFLRLDGGPSIYSQDWLAYTEWDLLHSVEDALKLGAQGVALMLFMGLSVELQTFRLVARVARECMSAGIALMVEALPCPSARIADPKDPLVAASAVRLAFEHGADLVKTYYTGSVQSFQPVVANCPIPVFIAGGPRMNTLHEVLSTADEAIKAGSKGIVFGRNIWQSDNMRAVIKALRCIVHDGMSPSEALSRANSI